MVFFAITRRGFEDALVLAPESAIWVTAGIATSQEVGSLRVRGRNITVFTREIRTDDPIAMAVAVATIRDHHPDETVWVESS